MTNNAILLVDSRHGIYIPKITAEYIIQGTVKVKNKKDKDILNALGDLGNPENEFYWESWDSLLNKVICLGLDGKEYYLHQDEDLWAIPVGESFDEK
jgi:hypothetical protein